MSKSPRRTLPPEVELQRLAGAYQLSRAVQVAARLGLGRLLAEGTRTVADLARETATDAPVLRRLLRFLAELRVVEEHPGDVFGPTPLSDRLDHLDNLVSGEEAWAVWDALPQALHSGRCVFPEVHGESFYDYAANHPEAAAHWREEGAASARRLAPRIAETLTIENTETVVDVGGGDGTVLAEILRRHPGCRGVLFDRPEALADAESVLQDAGVHERCEVVPGDAFREAPAGGDLYLLCRVLFNWGDAEAGELLGRCREASGTATGASSSGRLAVIEILLPESGEPRPRGFAAADLHHFLLWGSGYRTRTEIERLLTEAGWIPQASPVPLAPSPHSGAWHCLEALAVS